MGLDTKQVIVIRKDLKMRRGKEIAQGSHASMAFLTKQVRDVTRSKAEVYLSEEARQWLENGTKKVCVRVDSDKALLEVYNRAKELGLEVNMITDSGKTEFAGVPTRTCLCLGPNWSHEIDKVTGDLELY
jgi:peptidyl-tRNA hydrolase, PTH2 family